jgi:hypothetical protein
MHRLANPQEGILERARLLVPLSLANANLEEIAVLAGLATSTETLVKGAGGSEAYSAAEAFQNERLLGEGLTVTRNEPPILLVRGRPMIDPFHVTAATRARLARPKPGRKSPPRNQPRDALQARSVFDNWNDVLTHALRSCVAGCSSVNGQPISESGLSDERSNIINLLDAIMLLSTLTEQELPNGVDRVEQILATRRANVGAVGKLVVDTEKDRLVLLEIPAVGDFATYNTWAISQTFTHWPLKSLARCNAERCRRYFVPGASGYGRTIGIKYCHHYCSQQAHRG